MTKIFLAISNHGELLGGGEHSYIEFLSHLLPPWKPVAVIPQQGEVAARIAAHRMDFKVIPLPHVRPWNVGTMIKSIRSCAHVCKKASARLIYANGSRAAFYGGLAGRISGRPVIWHCRMTGRDIYLDPIITQLSNVIITNSKATAERFKGNSAGKVKVVYNGLDLQWLREKGVSKPDLVRPVWKVVLMVSRISRWKRHDLALAAFERIASFDPNAHFICVGAFNRLDPEWWEFLREKTVRSPFSDRIHWIGQVDDVRPWLRAASLLLLASENEPFGRVLVEAMACGVPVVATQCGGVPEIVRDGQDGILVKPGNADLMAKAISRVLGDNDLGRRLSMSAIERAKLFSLDAHIKQMVQIFDESIRK